MPLPLSISPEVQTALDEHKPLVALESTIISHGMPYPQNIETALQLEAVIRQHGAIPATIALINGQLKAGLTTNEIEAFGKKGQTIAKASRRDLAILMAQKEWGATTVAATMIVAHLAGINLFATGGIGGVHRGATHSMDISADLQELARTPVAVVCAGAKSILDLPLTLEYLETFGVPVLSYQTTEFPAFFTRKSGLTTDAAVQSAQEIADLLQLHWQLPQAGGVLIANPIPEAAEPDFAMIQDAIEQALLLAEEKRVRGKAITPFLLAQVEQLTQGASLQANIELVQNNARLAAAIAVAQRT